MKLCQQEVNEKRNAITDDKDGGKESRWTVERVKGFTMKNKFIKF